MTVPRRSLWLAVPLVALVAAGGYAAYGRWRAARACCPVSGEHRMAALPPGHPQIQAGEMKDAPALDDSVLSSKNAADCPYLKSQSKGPTAETLPVARTAPVEQWLKEGRTQTGGESHDVQ